MLEITRDIHINEVTARDIRGCKLNKHKLQLTVACMYKQCTHVHIHYWLY